MNLQKLQDIAREIALNPLTKEEEEEMREYVKQFYYGPTVDFTKLMNQQLVIDCLRKQIEERSHLSVHKRIIT